MNGNHSRPVARRPQRHRLRAAVTLAVVLVAGAACGDGTEAGGADRPLVVATHSVLGDLVANVAGDEADVEVIMPVGADPHEFEPSAAQVGLMTEADLLVANGLGFEVSLTDAIETAEQAGVTVVEPAEELDPLAFGESAEEHEEEADDHDHAEGTEDPHWFTDPLRAAEAVELVAAALSDLEGVDADVVTDQGAAYADQIRSAHAQIERRLAEVPEPRRRLVTGHEVFGYFADRYGFEVVGTVIPGGTTLAEPSSADLAELVGAVEAEGVPAVFADSSASADLSEILAAEVGRDVEVVALFSESLAGEGSGAETYLELIRTNAQRIADALA